MLALPEPSTPWGLVHSFLGWNNLPCYESRDSTTSQQRCPFVTADFPGSHYFGVPLSAVLITPALLVLCGADLLVVVGEGVTADTQAIRFFCSLLSFLSLLNCSFLCLLRGALKEVRKFIMVIFNGFLKSRTTRIELIQENFLEL